MKIVHIINSLTQGGAERLVVDLTNQLAKGNQVYLITFKTDDNKSNRFHLPELTDKVNYINLKLERGIKFNDIRKLNNELKKIEPDVVHCHLFVIYHVIWFAISNRKIKFFHTIHNDARNDCSTWYRRAVRRFLYKHNILIPVTISNKSRESYKEFYKLKTPVLIYNGRVMPEKTEKFDDVKYEIDQLKKKEDSTIFIHVGRFDDHQKNQTMLVKVFNRLIDEEENIILLILGTDFDSSEAEELKNSAKDGIYFLGLKQNVTDYLFAADAFCLSSRFEGMPISLLEAFACGCVPVCTPVGGITDLVTNKKTGFLSEGTDEQSYYTAIKGFLKDKNLVNKNYLQEYFRNNFDIRKCAADHLELYNSL